METVSKLLLVLMWAGLVSISNGFAQESAAKLPAKLIGHGGPIKAIKISEDGTKALSASFDYSVMLWNLTPGIRDSERIIQRLSGHSAAVNDVAFLNDSMAVSVGDDGAVIKWDLKSGRVLSRVETGPERLHQLTISPNGSQIAVAKWDGSARVFDVDSLKQVALMTGHRGRVNTVAYSPDGSQIYTGGYDGTIREWDAKTGEYLRPIYKHGWGINAIAIVEGGTSIVFGATQGTLGKILVSASNAVEALAKFDRPVQALVVSNNGQSIASGGGDGHINLFTISNGVLEEKYLATYGPVWNMAFTPDDREMLHVGLDDFIVSWQIAPRKQFEKVLSTYPRRFQEVRSNDPGELEFRRKCSVCHTLEADGKNRAGPTLYGIFGRKAGTLPGYPYSQALLDSQIIWNAESISRLFDEGPDIVTPGTKMPIQRLKSVERRDDLIRYLKKATVPQQQE